MLSFLVILLNNCLFSTHIFFLFPCLFTVVMVWVSLFPGTEKEAIQNAYLLPGEQSGNFSQQKPTNLKTHTNTYTPNIPFPNILKSLYQLHRFYTSVAFHWNI